MVKKIALEEHFCRPGSDRILGPTMTEVPPASGERFFRCLTDFGELRLRAWIRPASRARCCRSPGPACRSSAMPPRPCRKAREANDFLAREIAKRPDRYSGFAHLPMQDAKAAADELERCVRELKFCGAMINGHTNGQYLDSSLALSVLGARGGAGRHDLPPSGRSGARRPVLTGTRGCGAPPGNGASRPARTPCGWCSAAIFDRFPRSKLDARPSRRDLAVPALALRQPRRASTASSSPSRRRSTSRRTSCVTTSGMCSAEPLTCAISALGTTA